MDIAKLLGSLDSPWIGRLKQVLAASVQPLPSAEKPAAGVPTATVPPSSGTKAAASGETGGTANHGQRAFDCHRSAETHINAALYELDRLRDEVAAVLAKSPDQLLNPAQPSPASQQGRPSRAA